MALKLRLARHGAKKKPYYRIVVADSRSPRDGRFIDIVGSYNPMLPKDSEDRVKLNVDEIKVWLAKGARPTERVARFLGAAGLWDWKHGNNPEKGKPGAKAAQLILDKADKAEARKVAEAEAKEAAKEAAAAADLAAKEAEAAEKAAAAEAKAAPAKEEAPKEEAAPAEDAPAKEAPKEEAPKEEAPKEDKNAAYIAKVKKYDAEADEAVITKIINHCGIALQSEDGKYVACSDETERNTVRDSFLKKKLGLEGEDADLDAKVMAVCETMKDDNKKCRVAFYYLLAKNEGKLADL